MNILRDKKEMTRLLILYHSAVERPVKLSDLAEPLGMTEQGVSNYISMMEEEGLLDTSGKKYRPTPKGMELVRNVIAKLNIFIDEASQHMDLIKQCTAIAKEPINVGKEVGLYMEKGFLHADSSKRASSGIALTSAEAGEPLLVGELRGITEMKVGKINMVRSKLNGSLAESKKELERKLRSMEYDVLAITDETHRGLVQTLAIETDIVFAPLDASIDAAERGLNVALLISESDMESMIDRLQSINRDREEEFRIEHSVI